MNTGRKLLIAFGASTFTAPRGERPTTAGKGRPDRRTGAYSVGYAKGVGTTDCGAAVPQELLFARKR